MVFNGYQFYNCDNCCRHILTSRQRVDNNWNLKRIFFFLFLESLFFFSLYYYWYDFYLLKFCYCFLKIPFFLGSFINEKKGIVLLFFVFFSDENPMKKKKTKIIYASLIFFFFFVNFNTYPIVCCGQFCVQILCILAFFVFKSINNYFFIYFLLFFFCSY